MNSSSTEGRRFNRLLLVLFLLSGSTLVVVAGVRWLLPTPSPTFNGPLVAVRNSPATSTDPRAAALLRKVASRFDQCRQLDISVDAKLLAVWGQGSDLRQTATALNTYNRATNRWIIKGKTTPVHPNDPKSGAPYHLRSDPLGTTLALSHFNGGLPAPLANLEQGLEALTGVTGRTASLVPELSLPIPFEEPEWNPDRTRFLHYLAEWAQMEPEVAVDDLPCYRVTSTNEIGAWTLWIDKKTMLPRRVKETRDAAQLKKYRPDSHHTYWEHDYRVKIGVAR